MAQTHELFYMGLSSVSPSRYVESSTRRLLDQINTLGETGNSSPQRKNKKEKGKRPARSRCFCMPASFAFFSIII
jgi:hypothetical protein